MHACCVASTADKETDLYSDEQHEVDYCYGPDTITKSLHDRSVEPLLQKFVEGYNTAVIVFGSTGIDPIQTLLDQMTDCVQQL